MNIDKSLYRCRINAVDGGLLKHPKYRDDLVSLDEIFSKMAGRNGNSLSKISIQNYVNKINRLSVLCEGRLYDGNIDFLKHPEKVILEIKKSDLSSKKDYISPVIKILKLSEENEDIIKTYQKAMSDFKSSEDSFRKDNKASKKEKTLSMHLPEVQRRIKTFIPQNDTELVQKVICAFYFLNDNFTPRNDLPIFKIVSDKKKLNKMNDDFNYLVTNSEGKANGIIMNNYKTRYTYGRQKFMLSDDFKKILDEYLKVFGKIPGDYLFVDKKNEPFSESNFRNLIETSMENVVGVPINIGLARKIKITEWYSSNKPHTIHQNEDFARTLLHSCKIAQEYIKVDLFDKDD